MFGIQGEEIEIMDTKDTIPPHHLTTEILKIPCYEPAGRHIALDGEALTRNTMLTGSIGSGKTSTLNRILQQLIAFRADETDAKIGLIIFDFKQDKTAGRVREWARSVGREDDVEDLDASSETRLELFDDFNSLDDLEEVVESLLSSVPTKENSDNMYFEVARRKRLTSALALYRLVHDGPLYGPDVFDYMSFYMQSNSCGSGSKCIPHEFDAFERLLKKIPKDLPENLLSTIDAIESSMREWKSLDSRTASNESSTMSNFLNEVNGYSKFPYFGGREKRIIRVEDVVESGKILVLTVPALSQPTLASTLGRIIKGRFYRALQKRQLSYEDAGRLAGIIMDEYPLVATGGHSAQSDVTQLQALRSMRGFTIAATQGFEALNRVLGASETTALLAQIDQHFIFKSKESAVAKFTEDLWGFRYQARSVQGGAEQAVLPSGLEASADRQIVERVPRVGLPELTSLEPGEAWVWSPDTRKSKKPYWLVPLHTEISSSDQAPGKPEQSGAAWEAKLREGLRKKKKARSQKAVGSREEAVEKALEEEIFPEWEDCFSE